MLTMTSLKLIHKHTLPTFQNMTDEDVQKATNEIIEVNTNKIQNDILIKCNIK